MKQPKQNSHTPQARLKHHVTGAIERGEKTAIVAQVTSHTPGPWRVEESKLRPTYYIKWNAKQALATVPKLINYPAEQEANARLIAAAPELLEYLQIICEYKAGDTIDQLALNSFKRIVTKATGGAK